MPDDTTENIAEAPPEPAQNAIPLAPCPYCAGGGQVPDQVALGAELRKWRKSHNKSMRAVGRVMGFSAAYMHDLETGSRGWTAQRIEDYKRAVLEAEEMVERGAATGATE